MCDKSKNATLFRGTLFVRVRNNVSPFRGSFSCKSYPITKSVKDVNATLSQCSCGLKFGFRTFWTSCLKILGTSFLLNSLNFRYSIRHAFMRYFCPTMTKPKGRAIFGSLPAVVTKLPNCFYIMRCQMYIHYNSLSHMGYINIFKSDGFFNFLLLFYTNSVLTWWNFTILINKTESP